jgi:hypothetical protein
LAAYNRRFRLTGGPGTSLTRCSHVSTLGAGA